MKATALEEAIAGIKSAGIDFASGVPDSWMRDLHAHLEHDPDVTYVPVCNEGVGYSICAGAWLGGKRPLLAIENSGLRVACEYIARISMTSRIPVNLLISYRGDVGETEHWGVPHGIVVEPLLAALRIPYTVVREEGRLKDAIIRGSRLAIASQYPVATLISGDLVWTR